MVEPSAGQYVFLILKRMIMNDDGRLKALKYIYNEGSGYMSELMDKVGRDYANELVAVGFVICGYNPKAKTWRISEMAREFYLEIC